MRDEFLEAFYQSYLANMILVQSNRLTHVRLEVNNLMNYETDFGVFIPDPTIAGAVNDQYSSAGAAFSFQMLRLFRTTRHGSKRIAGVPESFVQDNVAVPAAVVALNAVADSLRSGVEVGGPGAGFSLRPVIIRKPLLVTTPPTVVNPVSDCVYRGVGSQNSRKQLLS